jgi:type I restriction-modification system DNA methylase subunit
MAAVKTETVTVRNEMSTNHNQVENRLWGTADELRANSKLRASEYSIPVLGLIFLRYADVKYSLDLEQFRSGAAVPTLNRNHVHGMPVTLPPEVLISDFQTLAEPINRLANSLGEKNETLRQTGNFLLPKLISGELDVSELDIATNREAA